MITKFLIWFICFLIKLLISFCVFIFICFAYLLTFGFIFNFCLDATAPIFIILWPFSSFAKAMKNY